MGTGTTDDSSAWKWWNRRRLRYALTLVAAGLAAFALMAGSIWATQPYLPIDEQGEVTLFTVILQGILFGIGLVAAQVAYTAGPVLELGLRLRQPAGYRRWAYRLGTWFSVALILALPVLAVAGAVVVVLTGSA